jgi:cytochrome o ubiquinol oxidase subunit 1
MLGKLTLSAIPFDQPIIMEPAASWARRAGILAGLTIRPPMAVEKWLADVGRPQATRRDVRIVALIMLLRGFADAIMMRLQLALAQLARLPAAASL